MSPGLVGITELREVEQGVSDRYEVLSEREARSFSSFAEGRRSKDIAALLSVSPTTIETHRAHVMQKLDLHNTAELVMYAARRPPDHRRQAWSPAEPCRSIRCSRGGYAVCLVLRPVSRTRELDVRDAAHRDFHEISSEGRAPRQDPALQ